jgi:hypothetical protein
LKYGLDDLFTRLPETIKANINLIFLALNVIKTVNSILILIFSFLFAWIDGLLGGLITQVQKRKTYQPEMAWAIALKSDNNPAGRWSF